MQAAINDDINLLATSIFILGLAGLEYGAGIILILIFKNINNKIELEETEYNLHSFFIHSKSNSHVNKYFW